mgnify:CR=1 FL=1
MGQVEQVTVLIHGTFANPAYDDPEVVVDELPWWRSTGDDADPATADLLQAALARRDPALAGTVWCPGRDPRDGDLAARDFTEWSGANSHRARQQAARALSQGLGELATRRGCTPESPLEVNYVGHSHGGNIALDSLEDVPANVRPRQVCLLGTPLTWQYVELRFLYVAFLAIFLVPFVLATIVESINPTGEAAQDPGWLVALLAVPALAGVFAMGLWPVFAVTMFIRRQTIRRSTGRPAYGPPPDQLTATLQGRPVVLFISDEDEADLMMHLGSAPLDAYQALFGLVRPVRTWLSSPKQVLLLPLRVVELLVLRPIAYVIVAPLLEVLLERFGLGFPTWSVLRRNYQMVSWTGRDPYGTALVKARIGADELKVPPRRRPSGAAVAPPPVERPRTRTEREQELERITRLRQTLGETLLGLVQQVHLSHSGYYKTEVVIERVADVIAAPDPGAVAAAGLDR